MNQRCECKTTSGKRCTRKSEINLNFCWQHINCQNIDNTTTATTITHVKPKVINPKVIKPKVIKQKVVKPKVVKSKVVKPKVVKPKVKGIKPKIKKIIKQQAKKLPELEAALTEFDARHLIAITKYFDEKLSIDSESIKFLREIADKLITYLYLPQEETIDSTKTRMLDLFDIYWGPAIDKGIMKKIDSYPKKYPHLPLMYVISVAREYINDIIELSINGVRDSKEDNKEIIQKTDIEKVLRSDYGIGIVYKKLYNIKNPNQ